MADRYMVTYVADGGDVITRWFHGAPDVLEMNRVRPPRARFFMRLFPKSMKYRVYDIETFRFHVTKNGNRRFEKYPQPVFEADDETTALAYARLRASA